MIDLSKLTPAPWKTYLGAGGGGGHFPYLPERSDMSIALVDAEFIALARQAFDVMMRRGWTTTKHMQHDKYHGWWAVLDEWDQDLFREGLHDDDPAPEMLTLWPDPFTALVEADKWYRENIGG